MSGDRETGKSCERGPGKERRKGGHGSKKRTKKERSRMKVKPKRGENAKEAKEAKEGNKVRERRGGGEKPTKAKGHFADVDVCLKQVMGGQIVARVTVGSHGGDKI
jgi:hypothetical protein